MARLRSYRRCFVAVCCLLAVHAAPLASQSASARGTIRGTIFDSLATGRPLVDAEVFLDGADRATRSDPRGRFRLDSVTPGEYALVFYHPSLDALGLSGPVRRIRVGEGEILDVELFTPSRGVFYQATCAAPADTGLGVLVGTVVRGTALKPVEGARVTASWTLWSITQAGMRQTIQEATALADRTGAYKLCGIPTDVPVQLRVQSGDGGIALEEMSLAERVVEARRVVLPDTSASLGELPLPSPAGSPNLSGRRNLEQGTASLVGVVRTPDGRPVANAQVALPDLGVFVVTPADGAFSLTGLPGGQRWVEVRAIGFRPLRVRAAFAEGKVARLTATFDATVTTLATLKVIGRAPPIETSGFEQRRRTGTGVYLSAQDIEKRRAYSVNDLFTGIPGVEVRLQGMSAVVVISRALGTGGVMANRCDPVWYVDGVRFRDADYGQQLFGADISSRPSFLDNIIRPSEIAGIEVYRSLSSAPPQYQPLDSSCGVILVWTKRRYGQ